MRNRNTLAIALLVLCLVWVMPGYAQFGGRGQGRGQGGGQGGGDQGSPADRQLWQAAFDGNLQEVQSAVAAGGNVNYRGKGGFAPLLVAARNGYLDIVKYLVEHGADIDASNNSRDKTPLLAAAFKGHMDIVEYLVSKGANINSQAINGWTPLHDAVYIGDVQVSKYLIDHGAKLDLRNERNETPLDTAVRGSRDAVQRGQTHATPQDYQEIENYIRSHMNNNKGTQG